MKHSFTDEQLLNLINNTISSKTEFNISDFTGGGVQITSTYNHQIIKYKVYLTFGYDEKRNSKSYSFDIKEDINFIWQQALLLKVKSMQTLSSSSGYSELNSLMSNNFKESLIEDRDNKIEDRDKECNDFVTTSLRKKNLREEPIIYITQSDFSLPKDTLWSKTTPEYRKAVVEHIDNFIIEQTSRAIANGKNDWMPKIDSEDFVLSMESKDYKYKNFVATYKTWLRRK